MLHTTVEKVTQRIIEKSRSSRTQYLQRLDAMAQRVRGSDRLGCANVAHAVAALGQDDRFKLVVERAPNIAIVSAYNDMLSAHAPFRRYPDIIKEEARSLGATAQFAGGVPAMCDGITQGTPAMELSLFSRDVIAMSTAVSLSHDVFDAALMLGVCDKIVPGLLIGALHFGHLPTIFVPAGPMLSGLSNSEKSKMRQLAAQGQLTREQLLDAESRAYSGEGTCTFYGTANSNQMLLEAMGLHVPGTAFVNPSEHEAREALTRRSVKNLLGITAGKAFTPIGRLVDERCIVNAVVALLSTGGSTNHLIHWVAVARSAGIELDWDDFAELSSCTPLLSRVYPNGQADVNQFQACGGPGYVISELLSAGLMHADVLTTSERGIQDYAKVVEYSGGKLNWLHPGASKDTSILRPAKDPFSPTGGVIVLKGNLGRGVIKASAVPKDRFLIKAQAMVFDSQDELQRAFQSGELTAFCEKHKGVVCVVRWQGPSANGMPELHKLTPPLAVLMDKGFDVALVTDGRMSGASGQVPAAIHLTPEAALGGPLARVENGDLIELDLKSGTLKVCVEESLWAARSTQVMPQVLTEQNKLGLGRELFGGFRKNVNSAEQGAVSWMD
jgi:phosphogluconate dehydratase